MTELSEKVKKSIDRLKSFEPDEGYYLAFSGGKDSCVCKALCDMAGVKYDAHYRVTSVDPPELVRFIMDQYPDVHRDIPHYADGKPKTMWNLIPKKKSLPTRIRRYCCEELKEDGGDGRYVVTGVRWAESPNRKKSAGPVLLVKGTPKEAKDSPDFQVPQRGDGVILVNDNTDSRRIIEQCLKRGKVNINPIVEWSDDEVWEFIRAERVPVCGLYNEGFTRLGCIGCPLAKNGRRREFARWPIYERNYKRAALKVIRYFNEQKGSTWTLEDYWNWWMELPVTPGQIALEGFEFEGPEDE